MVDFITSDIVTDHEEQFALNDLLKCDYFKKHREEYYAARDAGLLNRYRNYVALLQYLNDIYAYDEQHAKSYAKRFREGSKDWRNCEAVFSEVIVYRAYIRGIYEGLIRGIHLEEAESDIITERLDGSKMFLEVFCVMPSFPLPEDGKSKVYSVKTHTQTEMASIRQKLLRKISKQSQLNPCSKVVLRSSPLSFILARPYRGIAAFVLVSYCNHCFCRPLKRLASAVQLRPWPPHFQSLASLLPGHLVTLGHNSIH